MDISAKILPIADLHCDLLSYLAKDERRTPLDPAPRCSFPQLKAGHVFLQTLAIFTETQKGSVAVAQKEVEAFKRLASQGCSRLYARRLPQKREMIHIIAAIENGSGLCEEDEPLKAAFARLDTIDKEAGPLLYISLTWNTENRFGGGNATKIGLKEDGKQLLNYLNGKKIAIDLSHTSDWLAYDILNQIDGGNLHIPVIASHSNFRSVVNHPRNLPDELAKEVIRRGGVMGFNIVGFIAGEDYLSHITYGLSLGAEDNLCFGADFFCDDDPLPLNNLPRFNEEYPNASCYPKLLKLFEKELSQEQLEKIAYKNLDNFLQRISG